MVQAHPIIRILLADDHAMVRAGIRQLLEHSHAIQVVAEASNGLAAEQLIAEHKPDAAVLDIQMPKASGIEVTRWVRANIPEVGVLILTAFDDDPYVMAVLQAGANGYVLITATPQELIQAVQDVYAGKLVLDATLTQKLVAHFYSIPPKLVVEELTSREMDVLLLAAKGFTNKAIRIQLKISDRTVQGHLAHLFNKLQTSNRTEAVMRAVTLGWISHKAGAAGEE